MKIVNCQYCDKEYKSQGIRSHERSCSSNPNKQTGRIESASFESMFCENSKIARHAVKKRIIKNDLIEYFCHICGIGPEWMDEPMPLILDHKNGINNDNRIENLRFICSNCDSQLDTYKSKNIKK